MALRLEKAFATKAETWLQHQLAYDLAQAKKRAGNLNVIPVGNRPMEQQARLI